MWLKLVIFEGQSETIVTTPEGESKAVHDYFGDGTGRDLDDYNRIESTEDSILIEASTSVSIG